MVVPYSNHKLRDDPRMQTLQQGYNQQNGLLMHGSRFGTWKIIPIRLNYKKTKDRVDITKAGHTLTAGITQGMLLRI